MSRDISVTSSISGGFKARQNLLVVKLNTRLGEINISEILPSISDRNP